MAASLGAVRALCSRAGARVASHQRVAAVRQCGRTPFARAVSWRSEPSTFGSAVNLSRVKVSAITKHVAGKREVKRGGSATGAYPPEPPSPGGGGYTGAGNNYGRGGGGGGRGGGDSAGGAGDSGKSGLSGLFASYLALLESRPVLTKGVTAAVLNLAADTFCQKVVEKKDNVDSKRLGSFVAMGLFLVGPLLHYWYGFIGNVITTPGTPGVLMRLAVDQAFFAPLSVAAFICILLTAEGQSRAQVKAKLDQDFWPTCVAQWKLWVPFQFINFAFVPGNLQVAAANLIGLVWTVYISFATHNTLGKGDAKPAATPAAA